MMTGVWDVFADTGDPVCYLIYRSGAFEKEQPDDYADGAREDYKPAEIGRAHV